MTPLIEQLRAFALEPGALVYVVTTASGKRVPIFVDDIRAAGADDQALIGLVGRSACDHAAPGYFSGQNQTSVDDQ